MSLSSVSHRLEGVRSTVRSTPALLNLPSTPPSTPQRQQYRGGYGIPGYESRKTAAPRHAPSTLAALPDIATPLAGVRPPTSLPMPFGMDLNSYPSMEGRVVLVTGESGAEGG